MLTLTQTSKANVKSEIEDNKNRARCLATTLDISCISNILIGYIRAIALKWLISLVIKPLNPFTLPGSLIY